MTDALGDRMKSQYENRTRYYLPRRTYTLIRLDGKAFHTLTRGCEKPYDSMFIAAMDKTAAGLCKEIQGVEFAYTQSDEISLLLTDFAKVETAAWFDGNIQKIVSVSASIATAYFSESYFARVLTSYHAVFDSRVFTIPDVTEVYNYFVWRQEDCTRNSIQMLAQAHFSPRELHGKSCGALLAMLEEKGVYWTREPESFRHGRFIERVLVHKDVEYTHKKTGEKIVVEGAVRSVWQPVELPLFVQCPEWLQRRIPRYE